LKIIITRFKSIRSNAYGTFGTYAISVQEFQEDYLNIIMNLKVNKEPAITATTVWATAVEKNGSV
jgi:hypothetical protein